MLPILMVSNLQFLHLKPVLLKTYSSYTYETYVTFERIRELYNFAESTKVIHHTRFPSKVETRTFGQTRAFAQMEELDDNWLETLPV